MPELVASGQHAPKLEPTTEDLGLIESWASKGHALVSIARGLHIDEKTLRRWRKEHPAVVEALAVGKAKEHDLLLTRLMEKALNGDTIALLFLLKTRHAYREGGEVGSEARSIVTINLPGAMSADQYKQMVTIENGSDTAVE